MKAKQIITTVLVVFVIGTVAAMVAQEFQTEPEIQVSSDEAIATEEIMPVQIVAYYFYGNQRCPTCMSIEAYTEESLRTYFSDELETKLIKWNPINIEKPGNAHFIEDFQLDMKMVVLAELKDGKITKYKKLEDVWPLSNDQVAFLEYIKTETDAYLKELS